MVKFNESHKKEMGNYFELGVHKVYIMGVRFDETDDGREFAEFTVVDDNKAKEPKETTARLWFHTDKAIGYSFSIVRGLFTHNAAEDKKEQVKEMVNKVDDTKELDKLCQKLIGKEAWLEIEEDPSRTYKNEAGEVKPSINRNITGFEPVKKSAPATPDTTQPPFEEGSSDDQTMADF